LTQNSLKNVSNIGLLQALKLKLNLYYTIKMHFKNMTVAHK